MVWLLGRGEKRTELAFLAEREGRPPELTPKNTIIVVPYGRYCNATKFAGETDVIEALDAARAQYKIDPLRIAVAGFSMGGGSTWHLATHYPGPVVRRLARCRLRRNSDLYQSLTPPAKNRAPPGNKPSGTNTTPPVFAAISSTSPHSPTPEKSTPEGILGHHGGRHGKEGLKLERFIGPQTAHKYHPGNQDPLMNRLQELIANGREAVPREIRFSTYTLRYPESAWLRIEAMEKHWERADVHAKLEDRQLPVGRNEKHLRPALSASPPRPAAITIEDQKLELQGSDKPVA